MLGFRLQYVPTESAEHRDFLPAAPATSAEPAPVMAMRLRGDAGRLLCLVNPVEVPARACARYTRADGTSGVLPAVLDAIPMTRLGARLLPIDLPLGRAGVLRPASGELTTRAELDKGTTELRFATAGDDVGKVVLSGPPRELIPSGGELLPGQPLGPDAAYLITAHSTEVAVTMPTRT